MISTMIHFTDDRFYADRLINEMYQCKVNNQLRAITFNTIHLSDDRF